MTEKIIGYAGTYTRQSSKGIYQFEIDATSKKFTEVKVAAEVGSPTYLVISEDGNHLYSVAQDGESGGVAAYSISENGTLQIINEQLRKGVPPCHLDVHNGVLVTGNYHEGTVGLYTVNTNGSVEEAHFFDEHSGDGPHKRQEKPHVHFSGHTPDKKYVVVVDLGIDELSTYKVEGDKLVKVNELKVRPGSGPRHIVFHPNGKWAYMITELSSEVIVLDYNSADGSFSERQYIKAIPEDFTETNDASAIHISPDGRFVYTGNRGHDSIAIFSVDENSGELSFVEHSSTGGQWPRDFCLDPTGAFIVAANQHTNNLVLFERNEETGKLTQLDSEIEVPEAVCVKFL